VWTFSGRVGADAELRTTQSGEKFLNFRVCNSVGFGDRKTDQWADCTYWGKRAESVSSYVRKGDKITVSGELRLEGFQRRDGTPGSKLSVRVNDLDLAGRSDGGERQSGSSPTHGGYSSGTPNRGYGGGGGRDYGNEPKGGHGGRGGAKPAFDNDAEDEPPFISN
jgi:single-strand DNA-binding protein